MRLRYYASCVDLPDHKGYGASVRLLREMIDGSTEITRGTFLKHVYRGELWELETRLGYVHHWRQGLMMSNDWHVSYHKGTFNGKPCVYFVHSAIEYIFIP